MSGIDKTELKQHLLSLLQQEEAAAKHEVKQYRAASELDPDESTDTDGQSHAVEATDMALAFAQDAGHAHLKLRYVAELNFGPKMEVEEGAVVKVDGRHLIIAVATESFTYKGTEFLGVSPSAPIVSALLGKRKGDKVTFRDKTLHIEDVT